MLSSALQGQLCRNEVFMRAFHLDHFTMKIVFAPPEAETPFVITSFLSFNDHVAVHDTCLESFTVASSQHSAVIKSCLSANYAHHQKASFYNSSCSVHTYT